MAFSELFGIPQLRVVLLGNIGSGKSASGNTLLGTSYFDCKFSACPVTRQCKAKTVTQRRRRITVVDTPGLTAEMVTDTTKEKLLECLQLSAPGPNVFLLVIQLGRFTKEEKDTVERAAQLFKEHFYKFTIILFTFKDNLTNGSVSHYISTAGESLQQLLQKCGNRYHAFNNNNPSENDQAEQLVMKMNSLVEDNCGTFYTLDDAMARLLVPRLPEARLPDSDSDEEIITSPGARLRGARSLSELYFFDSDSDEEMIRSRDHDFFDHDFFEIQNKEVNLKEEFERLQISGLTKENLKKQAEILEKWKEQLESREKQLKDREEQLRKQEGEMEEKKKKLKEHLLKLSEDL